MLKLEQPKSLKLGFYPYTYVRTAVMKSLLFSKEDYQKMLKMSFSEITKSLQDSHYKKEINALAHDYSGADLLELALNKNLAETFKKLIRISSKELSMLIKEYAKRKDIEDIKTILRGKFTNSDEKAIVGSITGAGTLSYEFLLSLIKKESVEEVLNSCKLADFSLFNEGLKNLKENNNLVTIENILDKYYFTSLIKFSRILPKEGELFRAFILKEVEILNILTLFRLKRTGFRKDDIKKFIISSRVSLKDSKITALANLGDLDEIAKALEKTEYKNVIEKGIREFRKSNSLIALETCLYNYLLNQSMLLLHQHPLSVDVILGYMFAKDIEVRNLRIIIKGKQLGLSEDFIESQLVY